MYRVLDKSSLNRFTIYNGERESRDICELSFAIEKLEQREIVGDDLDGNSW